MTLHAGIRFAGMAVMALAGGLPAMAQPVRDPTVAPVTNAVAADTAAVGVEGMTVLVRDGRHYLVVGTRLYAPGDQVGAFKVERISETEVWLRDATKLIKVPRYSGVVRKSLPPSPGCAPVSPETSSQTEVAPCEDSPP
jgi:hypothetical protein